MQQSDHDLISDTIEEARTRVMEILQDVRSDHEDDRIGWEGELADMSERAEKAENALREVFDRLDDWHRGLCDRDEVITGPMIRELVSDRYSIKTANQEVRDWTPGE